MIRDYSTLYSKDEAEMLQDADNAVTECGLWDWLKEFNPKENEGFMFTKHENLDKIHSKMKLLDQHSGFTYGWIMRNIQYVAQHGFHELRKLRLKKLGACHCHAEKGLPGWCGVAGGGVPGCDH